MTGNENEQILVVVLWAQSIQYTAVEGVFQQLIPSVASKLETITYPIASKMETITFPISLY
jgi:hypothetical protein